MHPFRWVAWGFLIVFVDLRLGDFDVVPDALGWPLIIVGLFALSARHVAFRIAAAAAAVALVITIVAEYVTGRTMAAVNGSPIWGTVNTVVLTVFLFATCTGLRAAARVHGDQRTAASANVIRWTDLALTALVMALAAAAEFPTDSVEPNSGLAWLVLALGALELLVVIWFLALLFRAGSATHVLRPAPATP